MLKKFDGAYLEISKVTVDGELLRVTFANGDIAKIPTAKLVPARVRTRIRWIEAQPDTFGTAILVPAEPDSIEIPSDLLRRLSDKQFADYVVKLAEEQARLIGSRLRDLREGRGLSQAAVARLAQMEPANLSRIENGRFDVSSTTLWKVLAAMGCSVADLGSSPQVPRKRESAAAATS